MRGATCWFAVVMAVGVMSTPAARAETDSEASEIAALRRELKELATKNQQQIDALQRQVHELSTALGKSRATSASAPAPAASREAKPRPGSPQATETMPPTAAVTGLAVEPKAGPEVEAMTQMPRLPPSMFNLPGRSVVPPYTGAGPGTPGASPDTPAAPVSSGGNRVTLTLSGQVDRALLYGNDGHNSNLRQVDNNNSSTRFRIVGEAQPRADTVGGMNLEVEIRPNSSANQTLTQNLPQPASAVTPTIRQAEVYAGNPQYGEVRLGFGSTASYLSTEVDISGTAVATYQIVSDYDGGFAFRQKGAALVPGGTGGAFVLSPANSYGPAVASVFASFDGLSRDVRIRYDTPLWDGFQFATSLLDGGAFDVAGRFAREYDDFRVASAIALVAANSRFHSQPGAYGYAGVPADAGGISLAGTNSAPNAPTTADVSADGSKQADGSVSVLFNNGFNFTLAGGIRDPHYHDPTGRPLSPDLIYAKLGYQHKFFPEGITAFSVDFAEGDDVIFAGDHARAYGLAAVQNIDDFGMEVFVAPRFETLNRAFGSYHPILAVMSGARVRF
jgi:hypothetical protein